MQTSYYRDSPEATIASLYFLAFAMQGRAAISHVVPELRIYGPQHETFSSIRII